MRGGQRRRKGFTMTEMLVTVGIIAVLTAIAIPSIISIKRSLEFKKLNNYAEDIFLAAQSNLVDLKLSGGLTAIQTASSDHSVPRENNASFPDDDWSSEYCYATSADSALMAMLLPAGTIDSTLTQHQIMIEYNPYSGNVYAVFYSEGDEALSYNNVTRDESARKTMKLGYYSGSGLSTDSAELSASKPSIKLLNGE
jgi:prepilin-type N-terminal cleavage/methylation domain-containing protein